MELDEEMTNMIKQSVAGVVGSTMASAAVGAAMAMLAQFVVTNYKSKNLTGDTGMHPTENDAAMSQVEATGKDTDASLAKDEVKAKDGDLSAAKTDANAMNTEANALEGGAAAARTKAGAADIETKGLKMT